MEVCRIMIETNRLILRLMNENDFEDMLRIFTDKNVMKSFNLQSFSREQMKKSIDRSFFKLSDVSPSWFKGHV